jgi:hypothetical protein
MMLPGMEHEERKPELSQWYTEPLLAERIWALAKNGRHASVVEPSAGDGALLKAVLRSPRDCNRIMAVEVDPDRIGALEYLKWKAQRNGLRMTVASADWLTMLDSGERFDVAIMNSPFEDGQTEQHILHTLPRARRVIAVAQTSLLHGIERGEKFWPRVHVLSIAFLKRRPSFGIGKSGSKTGERDFSVFELAAVEPGDSPCSTPQLYWW